MPEVRHPFLFNIVDSKNYFMFLCRQEIETGPDRMGQGKHFLCSLPYRAPHRCIMQHFANLATSYTLI